MVLCVAPLLPPSSQAAVGKDALGTPLARQLLGSTDQQAAAAQAQAAAGPLDYSGAVALAASCLQAADGCSRGASLQVRCVGQLPSSLPML